MAAICAICDRERGSEHDWRVCQHCPEVTLDVENGKMSANTQRWYCPRCVKVLEKKRVLWITRATLCGHCGEVLP